MDNVKCHIREVGGGEGRRVMGIKQSSSSVSYMAWEAPNLDSNLSAEAKWLGDPGEAVALSELLFSLRSKTREWVSL